VGGGQTHPPMGLRPEADKKSLLLHERLRADDAKTPVGSYD
jgi:hypothetical protein